MCELHGIVGNYLIGSYLMLSPLSGEIYETFLREILPEINEDVSLGIRHRIRFQHDRAPAHFHRNARQYLKNAFPNTVGGYGVMDQ